MMGKVERMKRRKTCVFLVLAVMLLCSSAFIFLGCKKQGNISPYKVVDSGIWTYPEPVEKTFWLDNERVLVVSNKTLAPGGPGLEVITIWNVKTGQIDFSHQAEKIICVQDDQVFFVVKDDATGKRSHYRGPLDNPQEHPAPGQNMRIDNRFNCDWAPKSSRANVPYKIKLKDNNYLEITEESTLSPVHSRGKARYYEQENKPPIPLPVYVNLAGSHDIRFNQLRNAYLISPGGYMPGDSYYHSMWWLSRDGRLTQVPFPKKIILPVQGGFESFYPLRDGFLVNYTGGGTRSMTNTGAMGLYLIKGDDMEKVLLGAIHGLSISPDGCRAAFVHARHTEEYLSKTKPYRTVKTINFCEGGNKS